MRRPRYEIVAEYRKLVGKFYRHTQKAVQHGCPEDRIFVVVGYDDGLPKRAHDVTMQPYLIAWKCRLLPNGKIEHPAYKTPMSRKNKRLFNLKGRNGAVPTALIQLDSFYELWM